LLQILVKFAQHPGNQALKHLSHRLIW